MIKRKKRLCAVILTATLVMTGIQMPLGVQQVSAYTEDDACLLYTSVIADIVH